MTHATIDCWSRPGSTNRMPKSILAPARRGRSRSRSRPPLDYNNPPAPSYLNPARQASRDSSYPSRSRGLPAGREDEDGEIAQVKQYDMPRSPPPANPTQTDSRSHLTPTDMSMSPSAADTHQPREANRQDSREALASSSAADAAAELDQSMPQYATMSAAPDRPQDTQSIRQHDMGQQAIAQNRAIGMVGFAPRTPDLPDLRYGSADGIAMVADDTTASSSHGDGPEQTALALSTPAAKLPKLQSVLGHLSALFLGNIPAEFEHKQLLAWLLRKPKSAPSPIAFEFVGTPKPDIDATKRNAVVFYETIGDRDRAVLAHQGKCMGTSQTQSIIKPVPPKFGMNMQWHRVLPDRMEWMKELARSKVKPVGISREPSIAGKQSTEREGADARVSPAHPDTTTADFEPELTESSLRKRLEAQEQIRLRELAASSQGDDDRRAASNFSPQSDTGIDGDALPDGDQRPDDSPSQLKTAISPISFKLSKTRSLADRTQPATEAPTGVVLSIPTGPRNAKPVLRTGATRPAALTRTHSATSPPAGPRASAMGPEAADSNLTGLADRMRWPSGVRASKTLLERTQQQHQAADAPASSLASRIIGGSKPAGSAASSLLDRVSSATKRAREDDRDVQPSLAERLRRQS